MFPATATRRPARSNNCPVNAVTVVLPFVPVIANTCGAYCVSIFNSSKACANKLSSVPTHKPAACAACHTGATESGVRPGLLKTARMGCPSTNDASNGACLKTTLGCCVLNCARWGGCSRVSTTTTSAPWRTHQRTIASPESPRPRTSTESCCNARIRCLP